MKKCSLVLAVFLPLVTSPLFGQTVLFSDDFSTSESNGDPSNAIWGTYVRNATEDKTLKVTDANSERYFGQANNGYLHHRHKAGATGSVFIEANGEFATPSTVITVAFDFYVPSLTSWNAANAFVDPRFRLGVSGAFANNASRLANEIRFNTSVNGINSVIDSEDPSQNQNVNFYTQDAAHSAFFVYNNSLETVTYANSGMTLASSRYDLWVNGVRVIAGGGVDSTGIFQTAGTPLTTIGFGSFAGGSEMFIDNLVVYDGAWVIPEPSTSALIAGAFALAAICVRVQYRRRRCGT